MKAMTTLMASLALGSIAGCSAIFDMAEYDRAPGGGKSSSSSGGSSGQPDGDLDAGFKAKDSGSSGSVDASDPCTRESESNDVASEANVLGFGETCGVIADITDVDFYAFSAPADTQITVTIPNDVKVEILKNGSASSWTFTGSGGTVSVTAGDYVLRLSHVGVDGALEYKLAR